MLYEVQFQYAAGLRVLVIQAESEEQALSGALDKLLSEGQTVVNIASATWQVTELTTGDE